MNWLETTDCAASFGGQPAMEQRTADIDGVTADVRMFVQAGLLADVTVVMMTRNNAQDIDPMLASLRSEARYQSIKVVVADSGSTDGTLERVFAHPDVILLSTDESPAHVWTIREALRFEPDYHDILVLKPSLRILPGAIRILRRRMRVSEAGMVFPQLLDEGPLNDLREPQLPGMARLLGSATFGRRSSGRPEWLLDLGDNAESRRFPRPMKSSSWAAALISGKIVDHVANWDERPVLYSDENEYHRCVHGHGSSIWFEPSAVMKYGGVKSWEAAL